MDADTVTAVTLRPEHALGHLVRMQPAARHLLEQQLGAASDLVRDFNDAEIRGWHEEGRTQAWIAERCSVSQSTISRRFERLGLLSRPEAGGRPRGYAPCITPPRAIEPETNINQVEIRRAARPKRAKKGWVKQMRDLSRSLPWILRKRRPTPAQLMEALAILDEMRAEIEAALGQPTAPSTNGGMTRDEWIAYGGQTMQQRFVEVDS